MARKPLTHEEFLEKFKKQNKNAENIEILGEYKGTLTKIKCKCKIDGYEWETTPSILLNKNSGCPKCGGTMKLTHEEFINRMKEVNNDIEILGEYKGSKTKIKCKCKIDGYEWETIPNDLLSKNTGCPKCARKSQVEKQSKTHEEFIQEFYKKNKNAKNIEILNKYINNKTSIKCRCKIDNYEWEVKTNALLSQNQGCPKCKNRKQSKRQTFTHDEFLEKFKKQNINAKNIEILEEYKNNKIKIKCKCKIDNYIWYANPFNLLYDNSGCPKCSSSKGEKRIAEYLNSKNIQYKEQYRFKKCKFKYQLPFDFYIPSLNTIIEYDGRQHYEIVDHFGGLDGFIDTKIRDTVKTIYCKKNNIKLIRIPYWNYDRIEEILDINIED